MGVKKLRVTRSNPVLVELTFWLGLILVKLVMRVMKSWLRWSWLIQPPSPSSRLLLSTLVDCAEDLLTPETEVRPQDVEW